MRLTVKQTITCVFADLVCGFVRELTMVLLTDLFNTPPAGTARGQRTGKQILIFFFLPKQGLENNTASPRNPRLTASSFPCITNTKS